MLSFLVRRAAAGVVVLWAVATITFFIIRFAPGSPFTSERNASPEVRLNQERKYGFDRPLHVQYAKNLLGLVSGDLGPSIRLQGRDVGDVIWPAFRNSARLGAIAFVLAIVLGTGLGILASAGQNRWPDYAASSMATLGICVPNFLLGPILVLLFYFVLGWLQPTGWPANWTTWSELRLAILPALTLAMVHVAYLSRLTRAGMLDVLRRDYIRTARAKGLSEPALFVTHALKNGITPALTYSGPMVAYLITGSIVVERIFAINGLGTHFITSATNRDYSLIMGTVLVYSVAVIALNTAVDLLYGFLDPRVRVQ